mgnify:CR=1 FL=1
MDDIRQICEEAENAIRKYIFSKVKKRYIRNLSVEISAEQSENYGLQFTVMVELSVHPIYKGDVSRLVDKATDLAFKIIEKNMDVLRHEKRAG